MVMLGAFEAPKAHRMGVAPLMSGSFVALDDLALKAGEPPFPSRIRVGHRRYRVVALTQEQSDKEGLWGQHCPCPSALEIRVLRTRPSQTAAILLHELLHAVFMLTALHEVHQPSEEWIVESTAQVLTQVMQDNPELRTWLMWAWAQED